MALPRIAWIADPKKFGKKKDYPKPSLSNRLEKEAGCSFVRLTPKEIREGRLTSDNFDIFIIPGGYAPNFADALGLQGAKHVQDFVKSGGGYVGICAGAYLGTTWGFELLHVNILDIDHWNRGKTDDCKLIVTATGNAIAPNLPKAFSVRYNNGPLFDIQDQKVDALLTFESNLRGAKGTFPAVMKGSPALVAGSYGKGRVLLLSPHMEASTDVADAFRSFVFWTAGSKESVPSVIAAVASDNLYNTEHSNASIDGEDDDASGDEMDPSALIRMQSSSQFGSPDVEGSSADSDVSRGAPLAPLILVRNCSDGMGKKTEIEDITKHVVVIQQATRARKADSSVLLKAKAKAKAKAAPRVSVAVEAGVKLLRRELDYVCTLQGCILITAPHSMKLVRGGGETGESSRIHKRERYTAEIAVLLARQLNRLGLPASFMIWNRGAGPGRGGLDPNYLLETQFASSPWHRALHRWALGVGQGLQTPLFHLDIHGKVSEMLHLDLGAAPLEELWRMEDQPFIRTVKDHFGGELNAAMEKFKVVSKKGTPIRVDLDPRLHGFWGSDTVTTISHQSVLLGIPAVQLEMPPRLRENLIQDMVLIKAFAQSLASVFTDVVLPWWTERSKSKSKWPSQLPLNSKFAEDVNEQYPADFESWSTQLVEELMLLERTTTEVQI